MLTKLDFCGVWSQEFYECAVIFDKSNESDKIRSLKKIFNKFPATQNQKCEDCINILSDFSKSNCERLSCFNLLSTLAKTDSNLTFKIDIETVNRCLLSIKLTNGEEIRFELEISPDANRLKANVDAFLLKKTPAELKQQFIKDFSARNLKFTVANVPVSPSSIEHAEELMGKIIPNEHQKKLFYYLASQHFSLETIRLDKEFIIDYHKFKCLYRHFEAYSSGVFRFDLEYESVLKEGVDFAGAGITVKYKSIKWKSTILVFQDKIMCIGVNVEAQRIDNDIASSSEQ